ncbi:MAG: serine/threonine protein kinase [bacterium]|nr:serine/threonine protein kinase [bacterium]
MEARWSKIVIECRYCGAQSTPGEEGAPVPSSIPDDGRLRIAVSGRTYLILGQLAHGDSSDVYFARWVRRLGELVVVKCLRCPSDSDLMRREHAFLERLRHSPATGTERFAARIPEPIALSPVRVRGQERMIAVRRWRSGFLHSLEEVRRQHPRGVEPGVAIWTFKRLLEVLDWSHRSGVVHGAVLPPHVLIHPRDHGAMLVGWSTAGAWSRDARRGLIAISREWESWYPSRNGIGPEHDIAMAARCVLWMSGATSFNEPGRLPPGLAELLFRASSGGYDEAGKTIEQVSKRSLEDLGQPAYCPLAMPGWSI